MIPTGSDTTSSRNVVLTEMLSSVCRIALFVVVVVCLADKTDLQNTNDDRPCVVDTPAGNVSLVLDVRGTPGPEGPRGPRGPRGKKGATGMKGDRGEQGEKGVRGDVGPIGPNGLTGEVGSKGQKGAPGRQGLLGPTGPAGSTGPQGPRGEPGDTVLTEDEFDRIIDKVANKLNESIIADLLETNTGLNSIVHTLSDTVHKLKEQVHILEQQNPYTLCNITSHKWRRIAYFDTTLGHPCPSGLRTFTNTTTNQTVCGTTTKGPVRISMKFPTGGNYTNVCGRARGYSYDELAAFYPYHFRGQRTIDSNYVDGISITRGSPRQHLWTYAAGLSETYIDAYYSCPCARSDYNTSWIPDFVGNNYYCESGFVGKWATTVAWEDPLWDGEGCHASGNRCCDRYGWFHRQVPPSSDDVEVRWCKYWGIGGREGSNEEFFTDQLEIWVM